MLPELRSTNEPVALNASGNGIHGYAVVYNTLSKPMPLPDGSGMFREVIRPHAFDDCLNASPDVRCLRDHDQSQILGRTKAGTVALSVDDRGVRYEVASLPDCSYARDLRESIKRGDIDGSSFAFLPQDKEGNTGAKWRKEGDMFIREIHRAVLFDVSPVTSPAYTASSVALRSEFEAAKATEKKAMEAAATPPPPADLELNTQLQRQMDVSMNVFGYRHRAGRVRDWPAGPLVRGGNRPVLCPF